MVAAAAMTVVEAEERRQLVAPVAALAVAVAADVTAATVQQAAAQLS
jgi:hypothetical protein